MAEQDEQNQQNPIAQLGQPVLRRRADPVPVEKIRTPEFRGVIEGMLKIMQQAGGVGLAAPQVFLSQRVFLAALPERVWEGQPVPPTHSPAREDEKGRLEVEAF